MFCPKCQSEFHAEIAICEDCGVSLVNSLPDLGTISWKAIKEFSGYLPAEMAKNVLLENNIPAFVKGDFLSTAYGAKGWNSAGGKSVLYVDEKELTKAKSIIEGI
tara:strand:- start:7948 stop:8262 length:315 start_codon:yes stop_codon:yes gene_type:complete